MDLKGGGVDISIVVRYNVMDVLRGSFGKIKSEFRWRSPDKNEFISRKI